MNCEQCDGDTASCGVVGRLGTRPVPITRTARKNKAPSIATTISHRVSFGLKAPMSVPIPTPAMILSPARPSKRERAIIAFTEWSGNRTRALYDTELATLQNQLTQTHASNEQ